MRVSENRKLSPGMVDTRIDRFLKGMGCCRSVLKTEKKNREKRKWNGKVVYKTESEITDLRIDLKEGRSEE